MNWFLKDSEKPYWN